MLLEISNSFSKIHSISLCQNPIQEPFEIAVHTRSFPSSSIQILFFPLLNFQSFLYSGLYQELFGIQRGLDSGSVICYVKSICNSIILFKTGIITSSPQYYLIEE